MQRNNAKDEDQTQHQHDDGVDLEPGALVRVQPQHGARAAAGARSARAGRSDIRELLLLVGRRAASDGCARATRCGGRRRPRDAAARGRGAEDWGGRAG
jgi:hypothetical protein